MTGLVIVLVAVIAVVAHSGRSKSHTSACAPIPAGSVLPDGSTLSTFQVQNAARIYRIIAASRIGDPTQAAVDALDAAWTESRMINVPYGDRDSLGFFQERPSEGWGTAHQIMNPRYATRVWLRHLATLSDWAQRSPAVVAQKVEISAYPRRYETWVAVAQAEVEGLAGTAPGCRAQRLHGSRSDVAAGRS